MGASLPQRRTDCDPDLHTHHWPQSSTSNKDCPMKRTCRLPDRHRTHQLLTFALVGAAGLATAWTVFAAPPEDQTYMPVVPTKSFDEVYKADSGEKDEV